MKLPVWCMVVFAAISFSCDSKLETPPPNRKAQVQLISEQVLRYELQQSARAGESDASGLCVAISDGRTLTDPDPDTLGRLRARDRVRPASDCRYGRTLVIGPLVWVNSDEVRAGAAYLKAGTGETRLAYRVVLEDGYWRCVGPILLADPL
ncbi:MAG: hypothetical protein ABI672_02975 [Vicinamibacteria bacterium]